jgi:hypothetical protein
MLSGLSAYADLALPLAPTDKDKFFAGEEPVICNLPIKNPACAKICVEMKINYDGKKVIRDHDYDTKRFLAKPERIDTSGILARQIIVPVRTAKNIAKNAAISIDGISTHEIGNPNDKDCKWATIWVHGATPQKGELGVTDDIFGGAFNRMKRMAVANHGLYYSPSVEGQNGVAGLAALVKHIRIKTCRNGKIILNCGSAGVRSCWAAAEDKEVAKELGGMVLIGSGISYDYLKNHPAVESRVPILFAQGEDDGYDDLRDATLKMHEQDPNYPIRFLLYGKGGHMTPLRMLDWRQTMNCMLSQTEDVQRTQPPKWNDDKGTQRVQ